MLPKIEDARPFPEKVANLIALMEGHAPKGASVTMLKRFVLETRSRALTPRQRESLATIAVSLETNEDGLIWLIEHHKIMEVIKRIV